jgi:thiamine pyrophosphate-dependent acetolactate synthase large subunit-like protein
MGTAGARGEGDEAQLNELVEVLAMPVVYTFMGKVSLRVLLS